MLQETEDVKEDTMLVDNYLVIVHEYFSLLTEG